MPARRALLVGLVVVVVALGGATVAPAAPYAPGHAFPVLTDPEMRDLFRALRPLPGTSAIGTPPPITGDGAADARIRALATARGYRLTSVPNRGLVSVDGMAVQSDLAPAWRRLQAAARAAGHSLVIGSAYRSVATQQGIFRRRLAATGYSNAQIASGQADGAINEILRWHSVPGYSRHHTGHALDIAVAGQSHSSFGGTAAFRWLSADNYAAAKATGFIPSYPRGGAPQGPDFEPWEIVYVGTDAIACAIVHLPTIRDRAPTSCVRNLSWFVRDDVSGGGAEASVIYGRLFDAPVAGDWDGDGRAGPGVVRREGSNLLWHLRDPLSGGGATRSFAYGRVGDQPVVGDWDGDGDDDPGVVRIVGSNVQWLLRDATTSGPGTRVFAYGRAYDRALVGDWDGDGDDEPGVVRITSGHLSWLLRRSPTGGVAQVSFVYGTAGDRAIAGDWDHDGDDGPGVTRSSGGRLRWLLRDQLGGGVASRQALFGIETDRPLPADWGGPDRTGLAVTRPRT
jgi:hypothetical protein